MYANLILFTLIFQRLYRVTFIPEISKANYMVL